MPNIVTDDFNANSAGASPTGWTAADFEVSAATGGTVDFNVDGSKPVCLTAAATDDGNFHLAYYGTDCTPHHTVSGMWAGHTPGASDRFFAVCARVLASTPTTHYRIQDYATGGGSPGAKLVKSIAGVETVLGSIDKATTTYEKVVKVWLTVSGSTITGRIQRQDDSTYLAADGSWSASPVDCFSVTDTDIAPSGDCRAGWGMKYNNRYNTPIDNLQIDSIVLASPPGAPTDFVATPATPSGIDASWQDPNSDADEFQLQIATENTFSDPEFELTIDETTFLPPANGKIEVQLEPGTVYYLRIRGSNVGGVGDWSETVTLTTASVAGGRGRREFRGRMNRLGPGAARLVR